MTRTQALTKLLKAATEFLIKHPDKLENIIRFGMIGYNEMSNLEIEEELTKYFDHPIKIKK